VPQNANGTGATFTNPISIPSDGDQRNAASIEPAFEGLINNDEYMRLQLESSGVARIRREVSAAALKAVPTPVDGQVRALYLGPIPRLFFFRQGALFGADIPGLVYDSDGGAGYWASELYYLATGSGASLRLDNTILPPANRIVSAQESGEAAASTNASDPGGVFGPSLSLALTTGDLVLLEGHCTFAPQGADASGFVAIAVNGVDQTFSKRRWATSNPGNMPMTPSVLYTAASTTTHTIRLYQHAETLTSGTPQFVGPRSLRALIIRP
jgi:hypothetical protein